MFSVYRMPNSDPKLKPAFRVKISEVVRGNNPLGNGNVDFTGCEENEIHINLGDYAGDLEQARKKIQEFCNQNKVKYKGLGMGYATLYIGDTSHEITPYHIDINMMLKIVDEHRVELKKKAKSSEKRII